MMLHLVYLVLLGAVQLNGQGVVPPVVHTEQMTSKGLFSGASDIAVSPDYGAGSTAYIADTGNHCIRRAFLAENSESSSALVPTTTLAGKCGVASTDGELFDQPHSIALDSMHNRLWVLDNTKKLHGVDLTTGMVHEFDPGFETVPTAIAVAKGSGHLFIAFPEISVNNQVVRASIDVLLMCDLTAEVTADPAMATGWSPCKCSVETSAMEMFQQMMEGSFGQNLSPGGTFGSTRKVPCYKVQARSRADKSFSLTAMFKSSLRKPAGMTVDSDTGDLYVVDSGRNQLLRFQFIGDFPSSIEDVRHFNRVFEIIDEASTSMEVVAGKLQAGTRDGPITSALLTSPKSVAFDIVNRAVFIVGHDKAVRVLQLDTGEVSTLNLEIGGDTGVPYAHHEGQLMAVATGSLDSTTGEPVLYLVERAQHALLRIHPWRAPAGATGGDNGGGAKSSVATVVAWTMSIVLAGGLLFAGKRYWHRGGFSKRSALCCHNGSGSVDGSSLGGGGGDGSNNLRDRYRLLVPKEWLRDTTF